MAPKDDELLMRHTDDFLFLTPYLDRATSFLDTLLPGGWSDSLHWLVITLRIHVRGLTNLQNQKNIHELHKCVKYFIFVVHNHHALWEE